MRGVRAMHEVQRIALEVEALTGTNPFVFCEVPTPSTTRWVFQACVIRNERQALDYVNILVREARAGRGPFWCRYCPVVSFNGQAARDIHEADTHPAEVRRAARRLPR